MRKIVSDLPTWYKIVTGACFVLLAVSFFIPPVGIIDSSVITAVGEMGIFAMFGLLPYLIKTSKTVKVSKGDTQIEVHSKDAE